MRSDSYAKQYLSAAHYIQDDEDGNAILEFALVLPLIIALFISSVEFSRVFRVKEMMALSTREAAHMAFRECFDTQGALCSDDDPDLTRVDACLQHTAAIVKAAIDSRLPNATLVVSVYAFEGDDPGDLLAGGPDLVGFVHIPAATPGGELGQFGSSSDVDTNYRELLRNQQVIVFAEMFYTFPFLFEGNWFAGSDINFTPGIEMYDVTVF